MAADPALLKRIRACPCGAPPSPVLSRNTAPFKPQAVLETSTINFSQHFVPEDFRAGRPGHAPLIPGQEAEAVASVDQLTVT
jgi:hypothetical protein